MSIVTFTWIEQYTTRVSRNTSKKRDTQFLYLLKIYSVSGFESGKPSRDPWWQGRLGNNNEKFWSS